MEKSNKPTRIILTGPESTGKTQLTGDLAREFKGICAEEYARDYLLNLKRHYTFDDVHHIAKKQLAEMEFCMASGAAMIFMDTYLIITKIWFEVVYNNVPDWIDGEIGKTKDALYLLCKPDIPWKPDPLRENGGEMRIVLYRKYEDELIKAGLNFCYVQGMGEDRFWNAKEQITNFLSKK